MNRIWWRQDIPMTEKFVAMAIADAADDEGVAYPAVATIALKCSCSERAVQKSVKSLCAKGLLRRKERRDRSSFYIFVLDLLPQIDRQRRRKERGPHADLTGEPDSPDLFGTGERGSPTGAPRSLTGEPGAPRNISEPSIEPSIEILGDLTSPAPLVQQAEGQGKQARSMDQPPQLLLSEHIENRWRELKSKHPGIAAVRKIDDGLKHQIELRAKQHAQTGQTAIDVWNEALDAVGRSAFLAGRAPPGRGRDAPFRLSLAWLSKATNFREVIGGKYDDIRDPALCDPDTGRRLGPSEQALAITVARFRAGQERVGGRGNFSGDLIRIGNSA